MSAPVESGFDPGWLALREPADHLARAAALVDVLVGALRSVPGPLLVHDLGSGTGSMARWLAPRLPGPQRWVLHDHDPALLAVAADATTDLVDADGRRVGVETREADLTVLRAADLAGASVVTASALLDLLTADEVDGLAAAVAAAHCPALLTLSVTGRVELDPPDPLDAEVEAAFNAHQRRAVAGRSLLGPDAPAAAAAALRRTGMVVRSADSPWRLGPERAELLIPWLRGRAAAAIEYQPSLDRPADRWLQHRLAACEAGRLTAVVHHRDLLASPVEVAP